MPSPLLGLACLSTALAMGLVPVLFRSSQPFLRERLALSESRLDRLSQLLILSWVPLMPLAGWLVDHWGVREVLFTGSLVLGLAVSWLALCQSPAGLLWGILGLASAGACVTVAGVALMPVALHLFPRWSVGASICLGYVFVGLASVLTPAAMPWLSHRLGVRRTVLSLSLLCLVPAALIALVKEEVPGPAVVADTSLYDVRFWLIAFVAFLYSPLEQSLEIWPRPYLAEIGYAARAVIRLVAGFWCAFLLLRFGLGWMIRSGNEAWLVLTLLILSSMVLGNLAGAYGPTGGYLGLWVLGACYGPVLPALLGILEPDGTRRLPGQTVGAIFAISALSSLAAQPLLLAFAKRHSPRECMRIPMILGLVMAAPMLVVAVIRFGK
jgi:MFS family permease